MELPGNDTTSVNQVDRGKLSGDWTIGSPQATSDKVTAMIQQGTVTNQLAFQEEMSLLSVFVVER